MVETTIKSGRGEFNWTTRNRLPCENGERNPVFENASPQCEVERGM